jgi:predicted aspartyl protease
VVGQVNDQSAVMLVDTGADSTMLTMPGVSRLKLDARGDVAGRSLLGTSGESSMRFARVESLSIGGIKGVRQDMPVIGQIQFGEAIDAMVGANFLFQADVEFNLSKPEISFFQPIGCDTAFLAYWGGDAFFVEATRASGTDRRPMFKVQVNGHDVDAIIDSGAHSSVIDTQAAAAVGVTLDSPGVTRAGMSGGIGDKLVQNYL